MPKLICTVCRACRRLWAGWQAFSAETLELQERLLLLDRPWSEEPLSWTASGRLRGWVLPPEVPRQRDPTETGR